ncbi:MAG: STAS domain-containing protein [Leptospiraceae bacterium]|nr:STAS domain-containing protein [Leptospiraceae bacterium]MCB1321357.1 STAS domain-containing protein [Leptospiraceae bacterium]
MKCEFKVKNNGADLLIEVAGQLDMYCVAQAKSDLNSLVQQNGESPKVILDLSDLRTIDSSGIALLANTHKVLGEADRQLYLKNINSRIKSIFYNSFMDKIFNIIDDD